MCPSLAARTTSRLHLHSSHTDLKVASSTASHCCRYPVFEFDEVEQKHVPETFTFSHKKKQHGVMSGDLGNQEYLFGTVSGSLAPLRQLSLSNRHSLSGQCGGSPSCQSPHDRFVAFQNISLSSPCFTQKRMGHKYLYEKLYKKRFTSGESRTFLFSDFGYFICARYDV